MNQKLLSTAALALLAAACEPYDQGNYVRTDTTPSVAFQPGVRQIDTEHGIWGTQSIMPPPGLVTVRQGDLVGRTIRDGGGQGQLYVEYLLADPTTGEARYAVASSNSFGGYLLVPLSALYNDGSTVSVQASGRQLELMPKYSLADI